MRGDFVDLPLNKRATQGTFRSLIPRLYDGPGTFNQRNITNGRLTSTASKIIEDYLCYEPLKIVLLAVNRRTLTPSIFCIREGRFGSEVYISPVRPKDVNSPQRVDIHAPLRSDVALSLIHI